MKWECLEADSHRWILGGGVDGERGRAKAKRSLSLAVISGLLQPPLSCSSSMAISLLSDQLKGD